MNKSIYCLIFMAFSMYATAEEQCLGVLQLSKTKINQFNNKTSFESKAKAFCNEYSDYKKSGNAGSIGISYGSLGLNGSSSSSDVEGVAKKYCSSSDSQSLSEGAFSSYLEEVNPEAFNSYNICKELEKAGLIVSFAAIAEEETSLILPVSYRPYAAGADMKISYEIASDPDSSVNCSWDTSSISEANNNSIKNKILLLSWDKDGDVGGVLKCNRTRSDKEAIILLSSIKDGKHMSFLWEAYKDHEKYSTIKEMSDRVNDLNKKISTLQSAVVGFKSNKCPDGWVDYAPAYGRFLRGIDKSNTKIDPEGMRDVGALQEDSIKKHSHEIRMPAHWGDKPGGSAGLGIDDGGIEKYTINTQESGGDETRPKNVAVLYCTPA
ncbi:hypothetical protein I6G46_07720 [Serratia plymuthica]|uniref:hypothetical protein n=1 Tax=Serratia plymuthica TaxID=82996 RepID=UPI0018D7D0EA|nr:hypothetical protein [Serratia plymuthica]QPS88839.1 hypothetical protein I6G46_07720 [Serratia plymuthica]